MENMENKGSENVCGCGMGCHCGHGSMMHSMGGCGCHGGKHHLIRTILKLFIVIIIFWCGFKLGEMTGYIRGGYGYGGHTTMMRGDGYGMMQNYEYGTDSTPANGGLPK